MANKKSSSILKLIIAVLLIICVIFFLKSLFGNQEPAGPGNDDDKYSFFTPASSVYSSGWNNNESNAAQEITAAHAQTAEGARKKYTNILGNNQDKVTVMVYMCGTDLESQGAMASYDLREMATADLGDNINLIVYTGGCKQWHTDGISTKNNQIFRVLGDGQIEYLVENAGTSTMVNPENLTSFIEFCREHYEANRYELIFWDHGGGTISGYGYDEKYPNAGSMTLDKIDSALTDAGVKFDFIGFDACLMATTETALMLSEHADYLIGSEESEPGIGWYYTDWLNELGKNSSMDTVSIGKNIVDSFISQCRKDVPRQSATLSVVDLAELSYTVGDKLTAFAKGTAEMINDGEYRTVSGARGSSREFGTSSGVDMVDLVDLANKLGTKEGAELKSALLDAIKYNNTSSDMSNSYGLSIYFPYRNSRYVNTVLKTYDSIDMDSSYSDCIKSFAAYQSSGQISSGGSHSAYQNFDSYSSSDYYSGQSSADAVYELLNMFLGGSYEQEESYSDYYSNDWSWLFGGSGWDRSIAQFVADNHFDADLTWKDGKICLSKEQWKLVDDLQLNVFVDDGSGYIDLGKDNIYEIDKNGNLLKQEDLTWLAASADEEHWQVIPYYYESSLKDGENIIATGRVPVLLNGQSASLMLKLDDEGIELVGVSFDYDDNAIEAKSLSSLQAGDEINFVCDYYDYDGNFSAAYPLGDKLTVGDGGEIFFGDVDISSYNTVASYEFVDIYQQSYWTTAME